MFYSSPALNTSFSGVTVGFHPGECASVMRIVQLADKHPCQTSFAALTWVWKVFFSPCCHNCLHVYFLISFSLPKMHLDKPIWLIVEPKSPNYLLSPPYTVNMVARVFESQTNTQMMWLKVKEQSDWKEVWCSRALPQILTLDLITKSRVGGKGASFYLGCLLVSLLLLWSDWKQPNNNKLKECNSPPFVA